MKTKDVDMNRLTQAFENCEDLIIGFAPRRACMLVGLLQLALHHPELDSNDMTYQSAREIAEGIQKELAKQDPYLGEVLEIGWKDLFMFGLECEEGYNIFGNFEQLNPAKQYRLALLHQALMMATSWLDEVTDQSIEEVTDTVFKLAEDNLASKEYETIPKIIKNLDEDKFLK